MDESKEKETHSHPSFGQISFSRINTTGEHFYGSELAQNHYIQMEVMESEVTRELSRDWYFPRKKILSLRMSTGQFSELITSLNNGSGTPCTIEHVKGEKVPNLPVQESRKEFVHRKFEDRMKGFAKTIRERQQESKALVSKKTLTKDEMHQLQMNLDWLVSEVTCNIPFFAKCFQETMDEVVFEAKQEVENAIQHKINVLGLSALHEQNNLIAPTQTPSPE